jgi:hypothetical protein
VLLPKWVLKLLPFRIVVVPRGFERPAPSNAKEKDPAFLREMAESMRAAPVVYQNMSNMLKARHHLLSTPLSTTNGADRDCLAWRQEQARVEANLLDFLLRAPATAAHAINAFTTHEKDIQSAKYENWSLEELES